MQECQWIDRKYDIRGVEAKLQVTCRLYQSQINKRSQASSTIRNRHILWWDREQY